MLRPWFQFLSLSPNLGRYRWDGSFAIYFSFSYASYLHIESCTILDNECIYGIMVKHCERR